MATLGIPGKVSPLKKEDLNSSNEIGNRDGDIMLRKIENFLGEKNIPTEKKKFITRALQNTISTENINIAMGGGLS